MVLDYLAVGIDPEKTDIFVQSAIPEVGELQLILSMLVTLPRLERIPTIKEMASAAGLTALPFGLVGYPVLQAADILLPRAELVPIGRDNLPHIELARELARRFNHMYSDLFPEPEPLLGEEAVLPGIHGMQKMSKALDNALLLCDPAEVVDGNEMQKYADPNRVRTDILGRLECNPVFIHHDIIIPVDAELAELKERDHTGRVGDVE